MSEQPDIQITLEGDEADEPSTPLADVARIMAALIDSAPDVEATSTGTRIEARSAGVLVKMTVTAVEADAELVLDHDADQPVLPD